MLKVRVKLDRIDDLQAARYCAGMGVELLGCCFDQSQAKSLSLAQYLEIRSWVEGPKWVAEVQNMSQITSYKNQVDALELDSETQLELCRTYQIPLFYRFKPITYEDFKIFYQRYPNLAGFIIPLEATALKDLAYLNFLTQYERVFLAGNFKKSEVEYLLEKTALKGLALTYTTEADFDEIVAILEYLEVAD